VEVTSVLLTPLYHWSPADRHDQVRRDGLRPGSEPTVAHTCLAHVCLGPDPATAWQVSGGMDHVTDIDAWDLWQVRITEHDEVWVRPGYGPAVYEVQVRGTLPADRLWWAGRRTTHGVPDE
jgi:hypothetical protein